MHLVKIFVAPSMIILGIWSDIGRRVSCWVSSALEKRLWSNLVSRWVFSLLNPLFLMRLIMLFMSPGMISLNVRFYGWVRIFCRVCYFVVSSFNQSTECFLVSSRLSCFSIVGIFVHVSCLLIIPSISSVWMWQLWVNNHFWPGSLLNKWFFIFELITSWAICLLNPVRLVRGIILFIGPRTSSVWMFIFLN